MKNLLLLSLFLSSCFSVQTYWKADKFVTQNEFEKDEEECIMGSLHPVNQYGTLRVNEETFKECMRIKGYRQHNVNPS